MAEAVTEHQRRPDLGLVRGLVVVYALVAWAFLGMLLRMKMRWRHQDAELARPRSAGRRPTRAGARRSAEEVAAVTSADLVALVLLLSIAAYACGGGADFGAGFWDLIAGGADRGARPRALVDYAMAPVWEANNVWLVFVLVVTWKQYGGKRQQQKQK